MKTRRLEEKEYQVKETFCSGDMLRKAYLLKSGNVLTQHKAENNQMKFKVWDIHSKKNIEFL